MPKVSRLGHLGLRVENLAASLPFYRDVLGLEVTAESTFFLSARPQEEHHELLISERPEEKRSISQISFRVDTLEELRDYHRYLKEKKVPIDRLRTHGHSISIYLHDPEDNIIEIYWSTGLNVQGPVGKPVDLDLSRDETLQAHLR